MRISLDQPDGVHLVSAYEPGRVRIRDRSFQHSLIVTPTTLVETWRPSRMQDLEPADLQPLFALRPEVVLLGSGARQSFPTREVLSALYGSRLGFEIMDTAAACRTYNVLVAEGRAVAAALILEPC